MNKKRFYMFLSVMFIIFLSIIYLVFRSPNQPQTEILKVDKEDDVKLFYYRSVPGLSRAEEMGLVTPVFQSFQIPNTTYELKIDNIWYNHKQAVILYHVENFTEVACLGGDIYLDGEEPNYQFHSFRGTERIGRTPEKGVIYQGNFYSCLTLPPLLDSNQESLKNIDVLYFKPFLSIENASSPDEEDFFYSFSPIKIALNYSIDKENVKKISVDTSLQLGENHLKFYQANLSYAYNRIYFSYISNEKDLLYHFKGTIITDKGEEIPIEVSPKVITDYPYHYYIDLPPLELEPQSYNLTVDTLGFIGDDELNFIIQTDKIKKNRGTYVEGTLVKSLFNTDVILNEIQFNNDAIWINLQYTPHGNPIHPYRTLKTEMPLTTNAAEIMGNIYNIKRSIPNVISLYNHNLQEYNWLGSIQGAIKQQDDSISFCISREFWNSSKEILVVIKNLTYEIHVDKSVHIKLNGE